MNFSSSQAELDEATAATELLRRRRARSNLSEFAQAVDLPGRPVSDDEDEWVFHPVETKVALHHRAICDVLERVYQRDIDRAMLFAPPGSAKSTYTSVAHPAYVMGKRPGSQVILASYATPIALKQSRRCRQLVRSAKYRPLFRATIAAGNEGVEAWAMDNGSEFMAGGILSGMTGNRASDIIIDDPVAGRQEADSETTRKSTRQAYEDDLLTRLKPSGSVVLMQTRWHEDDLAGSILPIDWHGESGLIRCRDGKDWFVLCLPAEADRDDDPLGRKKGERLWPEWFGPDHFGVFKRNPRTWSALFQQKPTPEEGTYFRDEWFEYRWERRPKPLRIFGASDFAVTDEEDSSGRVDYTEHGIFGLDQNDRMYVLDWWYGQEDSSVWVERMCDLMFKWRPLCWIGEAGVIRRAVEPWLTRRMQQRRTPTRLEWLPSISDKPARARTAQAMASMRQIVFPTRSGFHERVIAQLVSFPGGAWDDAVDTVSLAARGIELVGNADDSPPPIHPAYGTDSRTGM